ncbi:hypothetical protein N657DRAFT_599182 [Parathielavia appendiculata]|uniref:BRCT domain-containing protein n=1 Tax=Parathielavia appendiculata TaxID=2587402 RepID=A0AAN6Z1L9_9PEZI|nr:hypothetical protein N657DRAFT_599182 [Parathielavia appendiculata]
MPAKSSKTFRQAEKRAFDGANESQDTLVIAHYLMMDFGVGLRSSSPPAGEAMPLPSPRQSLPSSKRGNMADAACPGELPDEKTRGTRLANDSKQSQCFSIPETQEVGIPEAARPVDDRPDRDAVDGNSGVVDLNLPDTLPASAELDSTSGRRKMDSTQASTQSNVGRSYDQYRRPISAGRTSPNGPSHNSGKLARSSSPGRGALDDDDTGVRFVFVNVAATNTVSPGQDDSGFVNFGSLAHSKHVASQKTAGSPTECLPETPAPPQNPFRHSRSQLLPTSQLFRGTQFSSPTKLASPTSSRPSLADFPVNSISPNPVISSPLKSRGIRSSSPVGVTSSPAVLPGTTSSGPDGVPSSPVNTASTGHPVVPESSHDGSRRKRSGPEPLATYEPMRKSQERRSTSEVRPDHVSSGEDDEDQDSIARWRRARSKKEAALKQLTAISLPRTVTAGDVEVPSTSQRRRPSQAEAYIAQCRGRNLADTDSECPVAVETTQKPRLQPWKRPIEEEESTQSDVEEKPVPTVDPNPAPVPVLPRSSTPSISQLARKSGMDGTYGDEIPETSPTSRLPELLPEVAPSVEPAPSEAKPTRNFQSSPPAFSTRSRKAKGARSYPRALSSSSSLSNLASTPHLPSSKPPTKVTTEPASSPTESTIVASSSPAVAETKRRDTRGRLPKPKTGSTESLRQSARVARRGSNSTDELARSASGTPTFEQSLRVSRLSVSRSVSRSGRVAMKPPPTQRDPRLFENMAFAISFLSKKPGESNDQFSARMELCNTITRRIRQAGGRILENGFDELFQALPMGTPSSSPAASSGAEIEISLTPEGRAMGFTALIADGHSRKVKYMQALALGLPCVAARWVTTCLDRNELVDWTPYLLCAGQSAFLGEAIRSRSLSPYDASTAKLADIVSRRAKLLEGSRILAVVKKTAEGRKIPYVFLARVLGASLTRVYTVDEARAEMKAAEDAGQPFDWVYVDGKPDEEALFAAGPTGTAGRKRKRAATGSFAVQLPVKRVRTLSDELVIQSLILGRIIEDGEMQV